MQRANQEYPSPNVLSLCFLYAVQINLNTFTIVIIPLLCFLSGSARKTLLEAKKRSNKPSAYYHPLFPLICLFLFLHLRCTKCTYFPWGNWDERGALRHCTRWWAGGNRLCPSCRALCRLCSETWLCRSLTAHTPWSPTPATGVHGPGTTTMDLQEDKKKKEQSSKFIDSITIVSGQAPRKIELGASWIWQKVKGGGETNKLKTEFYISSRPCSDTCKYSWLYFNHMDRIGLKLAFR